MKKIIFFIIFFLLITISFFTNEINKVSAGYDCAANQTLFIQQKYYDCDRNADCLSEGLYVKCNTTYIAAKPKKYVCETVCGDTDCWESCYWRPATEAVGKCYYCANYTTDGLNCRSGYNSTYIEGTLYNCDVNSDCPSTGYLTACDHGWEGRACFYCAPPCTPTTTCSGEGYECGNLYNGCVTISCGSADACHNCVNHELVVHAGNCTGRTCGPDSCGQGSCGTCGECQDCSTSSHSCYTPSFTVSGTVFVDTDGNGIKDGAEVGYGGAVITAKDPVSGELPTKLTRYEQNSSIITKTGTWSTYNASGASGGSYMRSRTVGASITISFVGKRLDVISLYGTTTGIDDFYLDGVFVKTVNTAANPDVLLQQVIYSTGEIPLGAHTVRIVRNDSSAVSKYLTLDAVDIWGPPSIVSNSTGAYDFSADKCSSYNASLGVPNGYNPTTPTSYSVSNIKSDSPGHNFGITIGTTTTTIPAPWIQTKGSDMRTEGPDGYDYPVPDPDVPTKCGTDTTYASINGSGESPGIIFAGTSSYFFCSDRACQNRASPKHWVVGGTSYPDSYNPAKTGEGLKTSYNYVASRLKEAGITPTTITELTVELVDGKNVISLANGAYKIEGDLSIPSEGSGEYTFPSGKDYVFLIKGNLNINGNIKVPENTSPQNTSTATFVVKGDIVVAANVGEDSNTSSLSNIEGFYSADKSFIMQGSNDCSAGPDKRLNLAGSLVINASLSGGTFQNNRTLCSGNLTCPVLHVSERPDLVLNAPEILKYKNSIWKEEAP